MRIDKIKKWDQRPLQIESKKLKEAVELAKQIIGGVVQVAPQQPPELNEHPLKDVATMLQELSRRFRGNSSSS